jgi:hypothetical protein
MLSGNRISHYPFVSVLADSRRFSLINDELTMDFLALSMLAFPAYRLPFWIWYTRPTDSPADLASCSPVMPYSNPRGSDGVAQRRLRRMRPAGGLEWLGSWISCKTLVSASHGTRNRRRYAPRKRRHGFFYRVDGVDYLITARHNFTGRHWQTNQLMYTAHAVDPTHVRVRVRERLLETLELDDHRSLPYASPEDFDRPATSEEVSAERFDRGTCRLGAGRQLFRIRD